MGLWSPLNGKPYIIGQCTHLHTSYSHMQIAMITFTMHYYKHTIVTIYIATQKNMVFKNWHPLPQPNTIPWDVGLWKMTSLCRSEHFMQNICLNFMPTPPQPHEVEGWWTLHFPVGLHLTLNSKVKNNFEGWPLHLKISQKIVHLVGTPTPWGGRFWKMTTLCSSLHVL